MSYHQVAVALRDEAIRKKKVELKKKYPYIDLDHFKILAPIADTNDGRPYVKEVEVFLQNTTSGEEIDLDITTKEFTGNSAFTKYLSSNRPFPIIWSSGGTIQSPPKGSNSNKENTGTLKRTGGTKASQ